MSTARLAVSSLFSLVANTAIAGTNVIDTVNTGVAKAKLYADDSLYEQRARSHGNRKDLKERIERDLTKRRADMNMADIAYQNQSKEHAEAFQEAQKHYEGLWDDFAH